MSRLCITEWTKKRRETIGSHTLHLLTVPDDRVTVARRKSAKVLPKHYSSEQRLSQAFDHLGKSGVATLLRNLLPQRKRIQSGDLGEILATEYINERTRYRVPINRLRWKDTRDMSMRGDDVIGISKASQKTCLRFLRAEAKSRRSLNVTAINEAREALDNNNGLPSPHSLIFIANRLSELGNDMLADAITCTLLTKNIAHEHVEHLMFTFTGNAPRKYLKSGLNDYTGSVRQIAVGLRVRSHPEFIKSVFESVLAE